MAARKNVKKPQTVIPAAPKVAIPTYAPVSTELTAYGTKGYRTPTRANQFTGLIGSPQEALVLDIDGTMQGWGGGLDKDLLKWCDKHYKRNPDIVFLVITARDHEYMYETSFNWCMRDFPYAFVGPFCRALDDPRLASEFKRQLAEGFETMGLYTIVGAADDNKFVNMMWKHWKATRNPEFDLLECDAYTDYGHWRSGLSSKGGGWGSYASTPTTTVVTPAKNRPAGTQKYTPAPKVEKPPVAEAPLPPVIPTREELEDQAHHANPHWTPEYIEKMTDADLRETVGITNGDYRQMLYEQIGYLFGSRCCDDELELLDLADIEPMLDMTREQIEAELDGRYDTWKAAKTEEENRRNQRLDLEDLALKVDPTLTLKTVEDMDSVDLHNRVAELLAAGEVVA